MQVLLVVLLAAVAASAPASYYSSPYLSGYPYHGLTRGYTGYTGYTGYNHYGYGALPALPVHGYGALPVVKYAPVPVVKTVVVPAPGYVAQTRGSLHTAPLPVGPSGETPSGAYASHHINLQPAAGTV